MGKFGKGESAGEAGFTLIEIVMVLVLLGILAAVAVPKFFDLQEQARLNAFDYSVAELQARINAKFSQELLSGQDCQRSQLAVWVEIYNLEGYTTEIKYVNEKGGIIIVSFMDNDGNNYPDRSFQLPVCKGTSYNP